MKLVAITPDGNISTEERDLETLSSWEIWHVTSEGFTPLAIRTMPPTLTGIPNPIIDAMIGISNIEHQGTAYVTGFANAINEDGDKVAIYHPVEPIDVINFYANKFKQCPSRGCSIL